MAPLKVTTHIVLSGRLRYNTYLDGDTLRDIVGDTVRAKRDLEGKWNRPVAKVKAPNPAAIGRGSWDTVKSLGGEAVQVSIDKGTYYYAPELAGVTPSKPRGSLSSLSYGSFGKSSKGASRNKETP
jgi:hypothetical protein